MIVDSTAKCVQTYHVPLGDIHIIPGRNLIRDDLGRQLMQCKPFQDMLKTKAIGYQKTIQVTMPPAEDPAQAKAKPGGKTPVVPPDGETAVSGMKVADAIEAIADCKVVDQLQDIASRDPRAGVKKAALDRITVLAAEAQNDKPTEDDQDEENEDEEAAT